MPFVMFPSVSNNGAPTSGFWSAAATKTRPLRLGLIGAGERGVKCFGALLNQRADAQIGALCDSNETRARRAQEMLAGDFNCYTNAQAMLRAEALDGIIITTPDYLHADMVVEALEAGARQILVDKPLATTTHDCLRIVAAMEKSGGQVAIGFNLRHLPLLAHIKEFIAAGELGELMALENQEFYDGGRTYMARWNRFYACSGGLWIHKGSHDFDVFNWWNQAATPLRVSAFAGLNALRPDKLPFATEEGKPVGPNCSDCAYLEKCPDAAPIETPLWNSETSSQDGYIKDLCLFLSDKDTHDNGIAIVEYDNNVRASHSECFACGFDDRIYTLTGTKGTIMARVSQPSHFEFRPRWGQSRTIEVPLAASGGHGGSDPLLLDNFLSAMRGEQTHGANWRDGLSAVAVGQAAEISWRQHRMVEISELVDLKNPISQTNKNQHSL